MLPAPLPLWLFLSLCSRGCLGVGATSELEIVAGGEAMRRTRISAHFNSRQMFAPTTLDKDTLNARYGRKYARTHANTHTRARILKTLCYKKRHKQISKDAAQK